MKKEKGEKKVRVEGREESGVEDEVGGERSGGLEV
jgi:hypothetical protein